MEKPTTQDTFPILGMSCAACAARVDKTLNKQPGVCQASVNYAAATALVEYDPSQTSPEALQHAVQEAGYDLVITHDEHTADEVEEAHRKKYQSLKQRTTWAILLAIPIAVIGMGFMDRPWAGWSTWLLSTPVVFWLGRSFFAHTWKQLRHGSANMDTLVASSTGVAYLFSVFNLFFPDFWLSRGITPHVYFESSSVIIAFILLGRLLEERAKGHTSQAIKKLMGLQPKTVTIVVPNEEPNLNEELKIKNEELRMKTIPQCKQSKDVLSEANDEWRVNGFESVTGQGVKGSYKGVTYYAGNQRLMQGKRISPALQEAASAWEAEAQTVIWFANETEVLAVIAIADRIKPSSIHAIRTLQAEGIEVHLLTGDNEATARAIARQAGITHYRAGVLPQDKAAFVKELQAQGKVIAMVGDGINDSAALAQADLSIAMGSGSDIAMDVAKMTIISSDLTKIPEALQLSRLTVRTIRQNLFWAFIYNIIGVPIAAGVLYPVNGFLLNPMIGGAAMAFSSVSVVTNSLRLRRKKLSGKEETDLSVKEANVDVERAKVAVEPAKEAVEQTHMDVEPHKEEKTMEKQFKVSGMMCQHCRMHVEKALNKLEGVSATVTLDPPVATVKFSGKTYTLDELQRQVTEEAGEYTLSDN